MAMVDYSDSDSDSAVGAQNNAGLKRKRIGEISERPHLSDLPPLPAGFHDLYASASRASSDDDPSLHEGRQRLRPHVIGNWPTHVYLEWYPSYTESNQLSDLISSIKATSQSVQEIHSLLDSDLGTHLPLHISLSQPVVLVTQQRDTFAELFEQFIKQSGVQPFEVSFGSLDWVPNHEKSRWFLVLRLEKPTDDGLNRLLRISNHTLGSFGQPPLYAERQQAIKPSFRDNGSMRGFHSNRNPRGESRLHKQPAHEVSKKHDHDFSSNFHISIGWSIERPSTEILEVSRNADLSDLLRLRVRFDAVKLKIGNTVTVVPCPKEVEIGKGLIGL